MTSEAKARQQIDGKLENAGWVIHDMKQLNLGTEVGVAAREEFDYVELAHKGGLQKVRGLFGKESDTSMIEMNEELVA